MKKEIYNARGTILIETVEDVPKCENQNFCDTCGECLYCFNEDNCFPNLQEGGDGKHRWIVYKD